MTGVSPRSELHRSAAQRLRPAKIEFTANELEPQLAVVRFPCAARLSCERPPGPGRWRPPAASDKS